MTERRVEAINEMMRHARAIWDEAVAAAEPRRLVRQAIAGEFADELHHARRILVVGGGKAGTAMAEGLEETLADRLDHIEGIVNVPQGTERPLRRIVSHAARPAGSNFPTPEGVAGSERMLQLLAGAGPDDVAVCLLSGGGSALMPAPARGIPLADKQATTRMLHASGASIDEMNCVRKHLSRIKGGRLAQAFRGRRLYCLIISDVVGDPLDVIASGPTSPDPTTFADCHEVLSRYHLLEQLPTAVWTHLEHGLSGNVPETLKHPLPQVDHRIVGSNVTSLRAAQTLAASLGYQVLNLGSLIEGETRDVAVACAGIVRSVLRHRVPLAVPCAILLGGETTVTLGPDSGKGGRNQEFVLAVLQKLDAEGRGHVVVLSAGTDGEDGPTDAAGAIASPATLDDAIGLGLLCSDFLRRHDAYHFFDRVGGLIHTGLTGTNVMDVRVVLIR